MNRKKEIISRFTLFIILFTALSGCALEPRLFTVGDSKIGVKYKRVRGTIFETKNLRSLYEIKRDSITEWIPKRDCKLPRFRRSLIRLFSL
jgi:hypothetical protein